MRFLQDNIFMPNANSTIASEVDALYYFILWASTVIFAIVVLGIIYFIVMTLAALSYRVPSEGWVPKGWVPPSDAEIEKKMISVMKKGSRKLIGTFNYSTFRSSSCSATSPVRTIKNFTVSKYKSTIKIRVKAKSFLQQQVRSMVGCIKYLGEEKWDIKHFEKVFKSKKRFLCAPPAPACGLFLEKVTY